jgi:hypothetical protein
MSGIEAEAGLVEYPAVRMSGDTLTAERVAFTPDGSSQEMTERWVFRDADHADWALLRRTAKGLEPFRTTTMERRRGAP